jgi:hypothetical protein
VLIKVPASFRPDEVEVVQGFRSLRFTSLFLAEYLQTLKHLEKNPRDQFKVRENVEAIVKLVNEGGGWNCIGWLRTGAVADVSAAVEGAEDIASEHINPHLVRIEPNDPNLLNSQAYKDSLYTHPNCLLNPIANPPAGPGPGQPNAGPGADPQPGN